VPATVRWSARVALEITAQPRRGDIPCSISLCTMVGRFAKPIMKTIVPSSRASASHLMPADPADS
jgi:hypothetical protein